VEAFVFDGDSCPQVGVSTTVNGLSVLAIYELHGLWADLPAFLPHPKKSLNPTQSRKQGWKNNTLPQVLPAEIFLLISKYITTRDLLPFMQVSASALQAGLSELQRRAHANETIYNTRLGSNPQTLLAYVAGREIWPLCVVCVVMFLLW
jgi:hypothetical protein